MKDHRLLLENGMLKRYTMKSPLSLTSKLFFGS
jgi:hypothetical protein